MILSDFGVIILFGKAWPQSEGRRHADPEVKLLPGSMEPPRPPHSSFAHAIDIFEYRTDANQ